MKVVITMGVILFLLVAGVTVYSYDRSDEGVELMSEDDFKDIESRYDCAKIQDSNKYSDCVDFYLHNTPYELGDKLVGWRK